MIKEIIVFRITLFISRELI